MPRLAAVEPARTSLNSSTVSAIIDESMAVNTPNINTARKYVWAPCTDANMGAVTMRR
jgi:hypothetical protein